MSREQETARPELGREGKSCRSDHRRLAEPFACQAQLAEAQAELARIGLMRPGSLSQQYKDPINKTDAYWQLSHTHDIRSRSRYVHPKKVARIKPLLANFKRFGQLVDRRVDLSLKIADRQTELFRAAGSEES